MLGFTVTGRDHQQPPPRGTRPASLKCYREMTAEKLQPLLASGAVRAGAVDPRTGRFVWIPPEAWRPTRAHTADGIPIPSLDLVLNGHGLPVPGIPTPVRPLLRTVDVEWLFGGQARAPSSAADVGKLDDVRLAAAEHWLLERVRHKAEAGRKQLLIPTVRLLKDEFKEFKLSWNERVAVYHRLPAAWVNVRTKVE